MILSASEGGKLFLTRSPSFSGANVWVTAPYICSVLSSLQKIGLVELTLKGAFVESIKNSRDKNNQYYFFLLFPFYVTFYPFVLSLFFPVSMVLPVNHKSLGHPKATASAVFSV